MRADRLISTLLLLQQRGRMSASALAAELEVSIRTVMRDLEALGSAGVPIYAERGPNGGFELWEGFRTQLSSVTVDEAEAAALLGVPAVAVEVGLGGALRRIRVKLEQAFPASLGDQFAAAFNVIGVELGHSSDEPEAVDFFVTAIRRTRVASVVVDGTERLVEPLGLIRSSTRWHVVATEDGSFVGFAVSAVSSLRTTGDRFSRPADFDLMNTWRSILEDGIGDGRGS